MLNSRAWLQKYLPLIRNAQDTPERELGQSGNEEQESLVTDSIPLIDHSNSLHGNASSGDEFINMDDWHIFGENAGWDFESSDGESEDFDATASDPGDVPVQASSSYQNLHSIPDEHSTDKQLLRYCFDSNEFNRGTKKVWNTFKQRAPYYVPVVMWLPKYSFGQWFLADLLTGLAIAAVVIPQGIAYSSLAQVPPVYGLYTAWMPCIIYFFMGTSRQLSIGPEGVISLLTGAAVYVGYQDVQDTQALYDYTLPRAAVLTFLVGVFTLLLGILRVGFLDNLISRPILHGFVSASAAIIFVGQLDTFLGFHVSEQEWEKIIGVAENLDLINWYSAGIGAICLTVIVVLDFTKKKVKSKIPAAEYIPTPLVIVVGATLLTWMFALEQKGVVILGDVEGGFPVPSIPRFWDLKMFESLAIEAILISIVGFVESNAIAKSYALEHSYEVSANRELVALGTANFFSSAFGSYPAFGSLSRSKIANSAGAKTPLFGLVASFIVLVTMLFLMPAFKYLPKSAIAAIVMVAAARLIEFHFEFLWKIRAYKEIGLTLFTFVATFFFGAELGIVLAIGISIFLVVKHTTLPSIEVLGRTSAGRWRDVRVMKGEAELFPGILVIRIDESLYFGNVEQIVKMLNRLLSLGRLDAHPTDQSVLQEEVMGLVIDARNIHTIDANALTVLKDMFEDYHRRGIEICFAHLKDDHIRNLYKGGLTKLITIEHFHLNLNSAVNYLQDKRNKISKDSISSEDLNRKQFIAPDTV